MEPKLTDPGTAHSATDGKMSLNVEQGKPEIPNTSSAVKDVNMIPGVDCNAANLTEAQVVFGSYLWPFIYSLDT